MTRLEISSLFAFIFFSLASRYGFLATTCVGTGAAFSFFGYRSFSETLGANRFYDF
jgi:hypothetical protein